jgi:mono/diheme cytochrome c family protein
LLSSVRLSAAALALTTALSCPAAAQQPADGVFTQTQTEQGRRIYSTFCANCHGVELEGNVGPALIGIDFATKWSRPDHAIPALYQVLRTTMPRPAAASLPESSYLEVMAYMLSRNGVAAGTRELASAGDLASVHSRRKPLARLPPRSPGVRCPSSSWVTVA